MRDATPLVRGLERAGLTIATGESLTAGMVASHIADVPGASAVLQGGIVAYQMSVKRDVLGVDAGLLERHGPVHPEVAEQMAIGAARACGARIGVSTTGVAGPEPHGGHPAGTAYIGWAVFDKAGTQVRARGHELLQLAGSRAEVRQATVDAVVALGEQILADS
ncbi:CinA family protein [Pseudoglutamicibacter cumminsii]|uniref:Damage-inducible protein CinA n=1 Tax=Pseudoglutamicibacter cumminsii TaxID=156979 RepID=A0ABX5L4G1_9MICC|nr:nicotinamide-nucleotide amidohydrolase family protein [Pseudoglutamicibacter cumminsii]PWI27576.1 damage-inducible protein CinA [Pseudoglutamicibacter cumminsii]